MFLLKQIFYIAVLLFTSHVCYGQTFAISVHKNNFLFAGIPNPIRIVVQNVPCNVLRFDVDNGKINKSEDDCEYIIQPEQTGGVTIRVFAGREEIGSGYFRVRDVPSPDAEIGGRSNGDMRKSSLQAQIGITGTLKNFDYDVRFVITHFTLIVLRNGQVVNCITNEGPYFNEEIRAIFHKLNIGDKVIFSNIRYQGYNFNKGGYLQPVELTIVK